MRARRMIGLAASALALTACGGSSEAIHRERAAPAQTPPSPAAPACEPTWVRYPRAVGFLSGTSELAR